ncbi:EAL domain-containing protein [Telmatospirillum sp. J64-1]|uniref:sensor domain-containing protein n=1 Tax=Telmatospirillum sp. J64-1 TaxID=2502183 RepID=UPI00115D471C|nr:EAL domain-containing protein [Telmatospirillum sp. J64-1]
MTQRNTTSPSSLGQTAQRRSPRQPGLLTAFYGAVGAVWILLTGSPAHPGQVLPADWPAWSLLAASALAAYLLLRRLASAPSRPVEGENGAYRQIVERAPNLIAVLREGRIAFLNPAGARLLGLDAPERAIGHAWGDYVEAETDETVRLRHGNSPAVEVSLTRVPMVWEGADATLIEASDVSPFLRAAEAHRQSEARLAGIMNTVVDAIITSDEHGIIQDFNPAAERMFGFTAEEIIGKSLNLLMPEEYGKRHDRYMRDYTDTGQATVIGIGREVIGQRKDGSTFPMDLALSELKLGDKRFFTGVIRDITERKRAESRLMVAEKVLESTAEGVMVTNSKGNIVWINSAFSTISGYSKEDVIGRNASLLKSGLQGPEFYREMWSVIRQTGRWSGEIWNRRKNGEAYPEWLSIHELREPNGGPSRFVGIFSDISKHKRAEETIKTLTYYDAVTRLPNRYLFEDRLSRALERSQRTGRQVAVVLVSLDRFKTVNETLGHQTGDALLREVADRLTAALRGEDTVARLRGDTFCCLLPDLGQGTDINTMVARLLEVFGTSFTLNGHEFFVTTSLGISLFPLDGSTPDDLIQKAETAMNRSKDKAENTYHFYTPEMNANSIERLRLETDLRKAIGRNELVLHYQPKVDTATGKVVGSEALVRWNHPELGLLQPGLFIPIAEETGLITQVGAWVIRAACQQIRQWQEDGLPVVPVAVNLSAHQFHQPNLVESILATLEETGVEASMLELELTESAIMQNAEITIQTLLHLHEKGLRLAIDDFGTGYSSLSYLKRFPIDKLKIDRSFVQDLGVNATGEQIVNAIVAMAHSLNLAVVAEGVETERQLESLRSMQCQEIQGYYFSRPVSAEEFVPFLKAGKVVGRGTA